MPNAVFFYGLVISVLSVMCVVAWIAWLHSHVVGSTARALESRETWEDDRLVDEFRKGHGLPAESVLIAEILRAVGRSLEVDYRKLRPKDSIQDLLRQSWLVEDFKCERLCAELVQVTGRDFSFHASWRTLSDLVFGLIMFVQSSQCDSASGARRPTVT
jgi:hypothetical protein